MLDLIGKDKPSSIGSRIKLAFNEHGKQRSVYRDLNSRGSFGASPLRKEIGISHATVIDEIEIQWHPSQEKQLFRNIKPNQFLRIHEGDTKLETIQLKRLNFKTVATHEHHTSSMEKK